MNASEPFADTLYIAGFVGLSKAPRWDGTLFNALDSRPQTRPITPQDLMATVFDVLGIELQTQFVNQGGRPVYMVEGGKPIPELGSVA